MEINAYCFLSFSPCEQAIHLAIHRPCVWGDPIRSGPASWRQNQHPHISGSVQTLLGLCLDLGARCWIPNYWHCCMNGWSLLEKHRMKQWNAVELQSRGVCAAYDNVAAQTTCSCAPGDQMSVCLGALGAPAHLCWDYFTKYVWGHCHCPHHGICTPAIQWKQSVVAAWWQTLSILHN